ncbi:hypothetical protein [Mesorhizobium sp. M0208]|uniref:hypothetical protein n=1 Tax=Mesorhizobium sp. M0208 TaxID=2956916 RepID=UPI00333D91F7
MLVSSSVYAGKSCSQLEAELYRTNSDLAPIMAVQDRIARRDVDGVFWLGLPVGSMMDNTDIKAREAKTRAEGQHERDQRSPTKGRLCCRHSVSRSNVKIVGLLPALATAEWSFID